jgi:pyruvate formate lyase activating enzyme
MAVTDAVMLDVKADPEPPAGEPTKGAEYGRVTGRSGGELLEKIDFLARTGKLWEVRTVVSPGLFDAPALVEKVCRRLAKSRPDGAAAPPRYKLIRYRPVGVRPAAAASLAEPDEGLMDTLAGICAKHGINAVVV